MSQLEESMIYALWSCACSVQAARSADSPALRDAMLALAAEWADKAWKGYRAKYPLDPEPAVGCGVSAAKPLAPRNRPDPDLACVEWEARIALRKERA